MPPLSAIPAPRVAGPANPLTRPPGTLGPAGYPVRAQAPLARPAPGQDQDRDHPGG
ncbi:MAG TPA: hypothetical protein VIK57_13895 [Streptosporangiaceae bacterium]